MAESSPDFSARTCASDMISMTPATMKFLQHYHEFWQVRAVTVIARSIRAYLLTLVSSSRRPSPGVQTQQSRRGLWCS